MADNRYSRLLLVLVLAQACGDSESSDASGSSDSSASADGTTTSSTTASTSSQSATTTAGDPICAFLVCGDSCTPPSCPTDDCSNYICDDAAGCFPAEDVTCNASIAACEDLACGAECVDPFCNDLEDGGMCPTALCDADGVCVPPAGYEMNPCPGGTDTAGSGTDSGGSTTATGTGSSG